VRTSSGAGGENASSAASTGTPMFARPRPVVAEDENDPGNLRRKKKSAYAALRKEEEQREKELSDLYRDRARERRDGVNKVHKSTNILV